MEISALTLQCGKQQLSLSEPRVMGIVNVTPDSFYTGSRVAGECELLERVERMILNEVDIIDIGGYSTRPGAAEVTAEEEKQRLDLAVKVIVRNFPQVMLSVDTFRAGIVQYLYEHYGPFIINDITAGADERMIPLAAKYNLPYVAMHMRGTPQTMQLLTDYEDVLDEVLSYLREKIAECRAAGARQVIIDPGFGFAKTVGQNYHLFSRLDAFAALDAPLLVGISRKAMIWRPLEIDPIGALSATSALNLQALLHGAAILRVHDVPEAVQMVKLMKLLKTC